MSRTLRTIETAIGSASDSALDCQAGNKIAYNRFVLHKTSKVSGFHIHARDGAIGHVDNFLFDGEWAIRYLVVDTSNWLGGKSVLISTTMVTELDSPAKRIYVNLT